MPEHLEHAIDLGDIPEGSPPTVEQQRQMLIALGALDPVEAAAQRAETAADRAETAADKAEVSEIAASGYSDTAALSATEAQGSATLADASALAAAGSATAAGMSESAAADSANDAGQSASLATDEANRADAAATTATAQAGIATEKAGDAIGAASTATDAATIAVTKAGEASTARDEAVLARNEAVPAAATATAKAGEASTSADNAAQSESNALDSENSASLHAATAEAAALSASASAALVDPLRMARAGGITLDGVSGTNNSYATAPRPQLAGTAFSIAFAYQRFVGGISNIAALITTSRRYSSADGGWYIRHTGPGGNTIAFTALSTGSDVVNVADALADVAVGDWCVLGFDLDNSGDPNEVTLGVYVNGVFKGSATSVGTAPYAESPANLPLSFARQMITNQDRAAMGLRNVALSNRLMTAQEHEDFAATGGAIVPTSLRGNLTMHCPCDEGVGWQCRDMSGSGNHLLLSPTGATHVIPKDDGVLPATGVNASSAMYLLRSGDVLPANAIVTGVIVDGAYQPVTAAQSMAQMRVRLNPSGSDLQVQRSNGTTHETIATFTPASLASVNINLLYRITS